MRSSYDIKNEMKKKFGENFLKDMERNKEEYEKYMKELKQVETVEERISNKYQQISKDFVYISDNYTIYPDEICRNYAHKLSRDCIVSGYNKQEEIRVFNELQQECLKQIKSECETLLKIVNEKLEDLKGE